MYVFIFVIDSVESLQKKLVELEKSGSTATTSERSTTKPKRFLQTSDDDDVEAGTEVRFYFSSSSSITQQFGDGSGGSFPLEIEGHCSPWPAALATVNFNLVPRLHQVGKNVIVIVSSHGLTSSMLLQVATAYLVFDRK